MIIAIDLRPLTSDNVSGVETYIENLLKHLFVLDKDSKYILFINSHKDYSQKLKKYEQSNVAILQTRIPNKILNILLILFKWPKLDLLIKKKTGEQPDIYFLPDLRPAPLSKNTKKIITIHDLSFHHYPEFFSLKSRIWHKLIKPEIEIGQSAQIIAVSSFTKEDLIKTFSVDKKKITTVYEGVDINLARLNTDTTDLKLPEKYFLFLSTLEPRKNIQNLINAYNIYTSKYGHDTKLVIAGSYNQKVFAKTNLRKSDNIIFTGFVNDYQKAYLYKNAVAFIYPSIFEGFGLPLLEAMIFSTPIITSNTSSMPEIVKNSAIKLDPQSAFDLSQALHKIQNSKTRLLLKQKMEERLKDFSWDKCAQETLNVFKKTFHQESPLSKITSLFSRNL